MTPDKYTNVESFLDVENGHNLYIHDWGKPDAEQVIMFVHGGPGAGTNDRHKSFFNPRKQRVIFFDQRGAGRSTYEQLLPHNSTNDSVEDIERIAVNLELESFILTGGSWGSCLSLAYALKYPKRVKHLVLRGIFTGSQAEADWIEQGGYRDFFPEIWHSLRAQTPSAHSDNPAQYHMKHILSRDSVAVKNSAYIYGNTQGALLRLDDRYQLPDPVTFDPRSAIIEAHYAVNQYFMPDRYILNNAHKLKMPLTIIQGRYDMVCPPITAWQLDQLMPDSEIIWTLSGHSGNDRPSVDVYRGVLSQLSRSV